MRGVVAGLLVLLSAPALAQTLCTQVADGVSAPVCATIPTALTVMPPAASPAGAAGTAGTYIPGNAQQPSQTRATNVVTAADGTFSVTWATPFASAVPIINPIPVNTTPSRPITCSIAARSATAASGTCMQAGSAVALTVLSVGYTLVGASTPAAGITVMIHGREPTQ